MTHQNTKKNIQILSDIIKSYNLTQHRGLSGNHTPTEYVKLAVTIHQLKFID